MRESERLTARLKAMQEDGLVDFKVDLDVYAVAKEHGLGIQLVNDEFGLPWPKLDFTNALVSREDVLEATAASVNAMLDAIDNGETEVLEFGDSHRPQVDVRLYSMLRTMGLTHEFALETARGFDFYL